MRKKSSNFTNTEVHFLVNLVENYRDIIENKKSDKFIWKAKEKAWTQIEEEFNAAMVTSRDAKSLKNKYECLKKVAKKNSSTISAILMQTEREKTTNVPTLSPVEEKIKEMILPGLKAMPTLVDFEESVAESVDSDFDGVNQRCLIEKYAALAEIRTREIQERMRRERESYEERRVQQEEEYLQRKQHRDEEHAFQMKILKRELEITKIKFEKIQMEMSTEPLCSNHWLVD